MKRWRHLSAVGATLGLLASMGIGAAADAPKAVTHTVTITGARFEPADLTVHVGDSVVWKNEDPYPHTATSNAGRFDSREIGAGKSWTYTASKTGTFPYLCTSHPTMKGTLVVN